MGVKSFTRLVGAAVVAVVCWAGMVGAQTTWNIGTVGDSSNVVAVLSDGTLTISGEGAMRNFGQSGATRPPWIVDGVQDEINTVIIEDGVTTVGDWAFRNCAEITEVVIGNDVTSIGWGAFRNCAGLTSVVIGNSVTSIGQSAFEDCINLISINIPNSVETIGPFAFRFCINLTSINIPNSVTTIEGAAFAVSGLTSITIPGSVTSMGDAVFMACADLTSVEIEYGITSITDYMFADAGVTSITIPNSVTTIGIGAFGAGGRCDLTSITIPGSVDSIGNIAFLSCTDLTSITVLSSDPIFIPSEVFDNVTKSTAILYVPQGSVNAYSSADVWGDFENIEPITTVAIAVPGFASPSSALSSPRVTIRGKTLSVVSSSSNSAAHIRLLDLRGRTVRNFTTTGSANFSLASISAGRYFVEIREDGRRFTTGVVVR
jgi:hypothetical protein